MSPAIPPLRRNAKLASGIGRASLACLAILAMHGMIDSPLAQTALEPEAAGADFPIQGEYSGNIENAAPMGAQVIALGSGAFKAVFLPGGLPGQGWNGKDRIEAAGTLSGGKAGFSGNGYTAGIEADGAALSGKTDKNEPFTLNKVHRKSPTEGAPAPSGALILFDGNGVTAWKDGTASIDERKLFKPEGTSASSGAVTKETFQSFTMHLEFRLPFMPSAAGQRRGNSGIYLQGRDELQVLDSFGNSLENGSDTMAAKRECGAFFEYFRPSLNMAFPPLSWQTYDIDFTAARYAADGVTKLDPAKAVVRWNGVEVHAGALLANSTLLGDAQGSAPGPQRFQAYGDPVFYRNIWITQGVSAVRPRDRRAPAGRRQGALGAPKTGDRIYADGRRVPAGRSGPVGRVLSDKPMFSMGVSNAF
jgi:hypothetical protein